MQENGMVCLLENEFFPWEGLPYPYEHAKHGIELVKNGKLEKAQAMVRFQEATLDHHKKPLLFFFRQEGGYSYQDLEKANFLFFESVGIQPAETCQFVDSQLGIVAIRDQHQTMVCMGSGCKSGMGAYLIENSGVINFGPQLLPLGDCSGFGLAGRGNKITANSHLLSYQCRLAAPHHRNTGIPWLRDSGYSGAWIESLCNISPEGLKISGKLMGFRSQNDFLITFFGKGKACYVAGSHKLCPRSLDRYQGPAQKIVLEEVSIYPEEGFHHMEVVPLAGDESFWGADFLIAFQLAQTHFCFSLSPTC